MDTTALDELGMTWRCVTKGAIDACYRAREGPCTDLAG
jgi:hypothetical protein